MLSRVNPSEHCPQVLCLSPTHELAMQTGKVIQAMSKFCPEVSVIFAVKQETRMWHDPCNEYYVVH
jgi:superfamily II DNA/RNA helicase